MKYIKSKTDGLIILNEPIL